MGKIIICRNDGYTIIEYEASGPNLPVRRSACDSCGRLYVYPAGAAKHVAQEHGTSVVSNA